jgi:hypothetical protein
MKRRFWVRLVLGILTALILAVIPATGIPGWGQVPPPGVDAASQPTPFTDAVQGMERQDGLFTLYRDHQTGKTLLEIQPDQFNRNYLGLITLESGIGEAWLLSGLELNRFLFQFRQVQDQVQFVLPNLYFRTTPDDPQQRAMNRAFSDSVLYSLPIVSRHPDRQSVLIDLADILLTDRDLANFRFQFPWLIGPEFTPDLDTSYIQAAKAFPLNIELEAVYGFFSTADPLAATDLASVPDNRAFSLGVRYSFSELQGSANYQPRPADNRVGYFITAYQDLSNLRRRDWFVRYINRWHLEPQDPSLPLSPPRQPILFWIENTVPEEYRETMRQGILSWNQAFQAAGIDGAIEVRQMPDDAAWDAADVRYNTVRWITTFRSGLGGIAQFRDNPMTGEILSADVLINGTTLRDIEVAGETLAQPTVQGAMAEAPCSARLTPLYHAWTTYRHTGQLPSRYGAALPAPGAEDLCFGREANRQLSMGSLSLALLHNTLPGSEQRQVLIHQFLRHLVAHEVGHALGLRHNFRASTLLDPEELNNPEITQTRGLSSSVMDYLPINLAPPGVEQGDFFSANPGAYDQWAIAYGYQPVPRDDPHQAAEILEAIASLSTEPELAYATDEDVYNGVDPMTSTWDLSREPLSYAQSQMDNANLLWSRLAQRYPLPGEDYDRLRERFDLVFFHYFNNSLNLNRYIGGRVFNRDRRDAPGARQPFEPVPAAEQRQALATLSQYVFAPDAFQFSPELINRLAPSRWRHWGSFPETGSLEYPIYDRVLFLQGMVLGDLLSSDRLANLRDGELRTTEPDRLTIAETFATVENAIWQELYDPDSDAQDISSLRRGLQRLYLEVLVDLTLRDRSALEDASSLMEFALAVQTMDAPEDARIIARYQLGELQEAITQTLRRQRRQMTTITRAHLEAVRDRIDKVLEAPILTSSSDVQ